MRFVPAVMLLTTLSILGCCKSEDKAAPTATPSAAAPGVKVAAPPAARPAAPPAAKAAAGAVEASAEMKAFMAMLDGKDDSARKALKKFGGPKPVQDDDLGMYTLASPKLTKSEKVGELQCYTMETAAGMMKHTSQLCWDAKGKIVKVADKSE